LKFAVSEILRRVDLGSTSSIVRSMRFTVQIESPFVAAADVPGRQSTLRPRDAHDKFQSIGREILALSTRKAMSAIADRLVLSKYSVPSKAEWVTRGVAY
jgi:hypothetical protein